MAMTPEEINAIHGYAGKLPAKKNGGTEIALQDTRSEAEKVVAMVSGTLPGPLAMFDGKVGQFKVKSTDKVLSATTPFIARTASTYTGFIRFFDDDTSPKRVGGMMYDADFTFPQRADLGDNDESAWPESFGKRADPWQHEFCIPMEDSDTQETIVFVTQSPTGRTAVGALLNVYNKMRRTNPGAEPIVLLKPSFYQHKTFGKVHIPSFVIVGKTTPDGIKRTTVAQDLNDEIPFFKA